MYCFGWPKKTWNRHFGEVMCWQLRDGKAECPFCGHVVRGLKEWELPMRCPVCNERVIGKKVVKQEEHSEV